MWIIFGASSPAEHKGIKASEKEHIESSLGMENNEKVHLEDLLSI